MSAGYFSFSQRDPHHWDVSAPTETGMRGVRRVFAIRGEPGAITIRDERNPKAPNIGPFASVLGAMTWCADALSASPDTTP